MAYAALFPAYPNEDYTTTITVGGLSPVNITGWTLVGAMFAPGAAGPANRYGEYGDYECFRRTGANQHHWPVFAAGSMGD